MRMNIFNYLSPLYTCYGSYTNTVLIILTHSALTIFETGIRLFIVLIVIHVHIRQFPELLSHAVIVHIKA